MMQCTLQIVVLEHIIPYLDEMKCGAFSCPALHYTYIICLSAPYIFLIVCPINRTIIFCTFWLFHILHEIFHRLHIHLCLFQRAYPVLRCNLVPYFQNLYGLFRLHIPESHQSVIRSTPVKILIQRNHFPSGCLPRGNLRENDKPSIAVERGAVLFQQSAERSISITVNFGNTLTWILRKAKKEQHRQRLQCGQLYHLNYYKEVTEKNRVYYELYHLDGTAEIPEDCA